MPWIFLAFCMALRQHKCEKLVQTYFDKTLLFEFFALEMSPKWGFSSLLGMKVWCVSNYLDGVKSA